MNSFSLPPAKPKKAPRKRYEVTVIKQAKTKDFAYQITDRRTKDVITMGGYSSSDSAWTGYDRAAVNLFQKQNIQKVE